MTIEDEKRFKSTSSRRLREVMGLTIVKKHTCIINIGNL